MRPIVWDPLSKTRSSCRLVAAAALALSGCAKASSAPATRVTEPPHGTPAAAASPDAAPPVVASATSAVQAPAEAASVGASEPAPEEGSATERCQIADDVCVAPETGDCACIESCARTCESCAKRCATECERCAAKCAPDEWGCNDACTSQFIHCPARCIEPAAQCSIDCITKGKCLAS